MKANVLNVCRAAAGLGRFSWTAIRAVIDFRANFGATATPMQRARWSQKWALHFQRALNLRVEVIGQPISDGLAAFNHLSYLDIVALATVRPMSFVSKAEVRSWPLLGWLAQYAGTVFLRRTVRGDVKHASEGMLEVVQSGVPVTLFPEGTSSDGSAVLPFRSSLFSSAVEHNWSVTPGWIGYDVDAGTVEDDVCYWRDMTFLPHFLKLLTHREIRCRIVFGQPAPPATDRKQLAAHLHQAVCSLAAANAFRTSALRQREDFQQASGLVNTARPLLQGQS